MNIIAVTGVHGAGKSTLVSELELRIKQSGKSVYVVREVARSCLYKLGTIDAQDYIFHNQMEQERCAFKQDVCTLLLDRMILDNIVYYYAVLEDTIGKHDDSTAWKRWDNLYKQAIRWMPTYDHVVRMPLNPEWLRADDPIRSKDVEYAKRIDKLFDLFVEPFVTDHGEVGL